MGDAVTTQTKPNPAVAEREAIVSFILKRMDELEKNMGPKASEPLVAELSVLVARLRFGAQHDR